MYIFTHIYIYTYKYQVNKYISPEIAPTRVDSAAGGQTQAIGQALRAPLASCECPERSCEVGRLR